MQSNARSEDLSQLHRKLENRIEDEMKRPLPNALEVSRLKREKLRVKEQMQMGAKRQGPAVNGSNGSAAPHH